MCGLVGVAGWMSAKEEKVFSNLLILDTLRGDHSTGMASVLSNGEVQVAKELGNPWNLFSSKDYKDTMKYLSRVLIGHNRFATVGGISKETAHPFQFEHITGVHNGTLRNRHKLLDSHKFRVDSENLYHHIEQKGLNDLMENLDGAYALVWWDKRTNELNFLRNKERPMWVAFSQDLKTMFWASEPWMITAACDRNGVKIHNPVETGIDSYYRYHIDNLGVISKPKVKHTPTRFVAPVFTQGGWKRQNHPSIHNYGHQLSVGNGTSNVLHLKKKDTIVSTPAVNTPNISPDKVAAYTGTKYTELEVLGNNVDSNGGRYVSLMDGLYPSYPIRLYVNKKDRNHFPIGSQILATIGGFFTKKGEGGFFKVSPDSYKVIEEIDPNLLYDDGEGRLMNKKDWEDKFQRCEWCFDALYAEDHGNRLTNAGGCVCGKCATITEVRAEFQLKAVY
jgi:predicted glutamine amidotransferase